MLQGHIITTIELMHDRFRGGRHPGCGPLPPESADSTVDIQCRGREIDPGSATTNRAIFACGGSDLLLLKNVITAVLVDMLNAEFLFMGFKNFLLILLQLMDIKI